MSFNLTGEWLANKIKQADVENWEELIQRVNESIETGIIAGERFVRCSRMLGETIGEELSYCAPMAIAYLFGPEQLPNDPLRLRRSKTFRHAFETGVNNSRFIVKNPSKADDLSRMLHLNSCIGGIAVGTGRRKPDVGHVELLLPGLGIMAAAEPETVQGLLELIRITADGGEADMVPPQKIIDWAIKDDKERPAIFILFGPDAGSAI